MCWRDDVEDTRLCSACGMTYYGSLGHLGCPARQEFGKKDLKRVPKATPNAFPSKEEGK